ncbi:ATP phosphoribosyltransferase [Striga asiatica]|uniref:ATP phosphoribosyltransferase n=1 Tax=Striga asiatica TaxID=4170 RepID=A0A5A7Q4I2_STRAF|nr:ATP phosphoribosyltransferase [Striga asiatica]
MALERTVFLQRPLGSAPSFQTPSYRLSDASSLKFVSCCSVASSATVINGNVGLPIVGETSESAAVYCGNSTGVPLICVPKPLELYLAVAMGLSVHSLLCFCRFKSENLKKGIQVPLCQCRREDNFCIMFMGLQFKWVCIICVAKYSLVMLQLANLEVLVSTAKKHREETGIQRFRPWNCWFGHCKRIWAVRCSEGDVYAGDEDLILVHEALDYGDYRLSLAIPKYGIFENINSLKELAQMPQWTSEKPLRVATGFTYVRLSCPFFFLLYLYFIASKICSWMGIADAIVDLVSSGTTLRENNLKEIEGGVILESQAVLVAGQFMVQTTNYLDNYKRYPPKFNITRKSSNYLYKITNTNLKRYKHPLEVLYLPCECPVLKAVKINKCMVVSVILKAYIVTANMRGSSADEVAERVLSQPSLSGFQVFNLSSFVHISNLWIV